MSLARHGHACGPWRNASSPGSPIEFVVVGGVGAEESTIIYNIEQDEWREGEPYNYEQFRFACTCLLTENCFATFLCYTKICAIYSYGSSVPFEDTLFVVGGRNADSSDFYSSGYILTDSDGWDYHGSAGSYFSQGAVVYIDENILSLYGCSELLNV